MSKKRKVYLRLNAGLFSNNWWKESKFVIHKVLYIEILNLKMSFLNPKLVLESKLSILVLQAELLQTLLKKQMLEHLNSCLRKF